MSLNVNNSFPSTVSGRQREKTGPNGGMGTKLALRRGGTKKAGAPKGVCVWVSVCVCVCVCVCAHMLICMCKLTVLSHQLIFNTSATSTVLESRREKEGLNRGVCTKVALQRGRRKKAAEARGGCIYVCVSIAHVQM